MCAKSKKTAFELESELLAEEQVPQLDSGLYSDNVLDCNLEQDGFVLDFEADEDTGLDEGIFFEFQPDSSDTASL